MSATRKTRVAVIGGGVSGLSVAHELCKGDRAQHFLVTVFERREYLGGKAASGELDDLPAEHGFRFFPGFYQNVIRTMQEIPAAGGSGHVADHLVELDTAIMADKNGRRLTTPLPTRVPRPLTWERIKGTWSFRKSMPNPWESACFLAILARLATTCEERWETQLEHQSWLEHVMSSGRTRQRSPKFQRLFAVGLTRSFVATRAEEMSARTGGKILLQLLYDTYFGPPLRDAPDRALDGPTSEVWIYPWRRDLESRGVDFKTGWAVTGLEMAGKEVADLQLEKVPPVAPSGGEPVKNRAPTDGETHQELSSAESETTGEARPPAPGSPQQATVKMLASVMMAQDESGGPRPPLVPPFDWYVLAVPCEVLKQLLVNSPELVQQDEGLAKVFNLQTKWMNGIVLGVPDALDPPLPKGHVLCLDSQWALTLVDQTKLWADDHLKAVRKRWQTLLSVDISDWDSPGIWGLPAKWPPMRRELLDDLWRQLRQHLPVLPETPPRSFNLDFDIQNANLSVERGGPDTIAAKRTNDEPLLINTPGSWDNRPKARTCVPNLLVAGDFAQTYTNFASMEAANEAGRRAVSALFGASSYAGDCCYYDLTDPKIWWFSRPQRVARAIDSIIYRRGLPLRPPFRLPLLAWFILGPIARLTRTDARHAQRAD